VSRRERRQTDPPGQDAFLDVVANLVGIMIILVMVVGARAKIGREDPVRLDESKKAIEGLRLSVAESRTTAASFEADNNEIERKIKIQQAAIELRRQEREQVHLGLTTAKQALEEKRKDLNDRERLAMELQASLDQSLDELQDLQRKRLAAENASAPVAVIDHLPTPMAKTVFGKEIHFRLKDNRVVHVPMNSLVEELKRELPSAIRKLQDSNQVIDTVGPIGGFRLRYGLQIVEQVAYTRFGQARQKSGEFEGFVLIPTHEPQGEHIDEALKPGSQFLRNIERLNPEGTTVTVWVYPDSFNAFRALKQELFNRRFLTASWPLPEGQPIAGSPQGRRSTAQ
jgi:hypothetical protein